jgi:Retrotransposon gag protein/Zinc knuckle
MMGALPAIFDGNREWADDFIEELKAYIRLNNNIGGMNSYLKRIALALTLIKGPLVASWTRDFGNFFDTLNAADDIPATWTAFLDEFAHQFQDTQREERTKLKLQTLRMKWPEIDQYISQFEQLAREAGYTIGNSETKQFFIQGLPRGVAEDVMKPPLIHTYTDIKERAIESVKSQQVIDQIFSPRRTPFPTRGTNPNPFNRPNRGGRPQQRPQPQPGRPQYTSTNAPPWMANQPVLMDVDRNKAGPSARGRAIQSQPRQPQQAQLCFQCNQPGHFARNCPQRKTQASLIDWNDDDETVAEEPKDKVAWMEEQLRSLTLEESSSLGERMREQQDFHSV